MALTSSQNSQVNKIKSTLSSISKGLSSMSATEKKKFDNSSASNQLGNVLKSGITTVSNIAKSSSNSTPNISKINTDSLNQSTAWTEPTTPIPDNVGNVTQAGNVGLASSIPGMTINDKGMFEQSPASMTQADFANYILGNTPKPVNTEKIALNSNEYKARNTAQQEINNYAAQLNAITAQSQAQQLALEGQGRGQTSAFIGGEQARINREAAIAALPVQAQLAAAQGNLEFAQKQFDTVMTYRLQDAQNKYKYETDRLNSIVGFLSKAEERQYAERLKINDREYQKTQDNINYLRNLMDKARVNGQSNLVGQLSAQNPGSLTFDKDIAAIASQITDTNSALQREALRINIEKDKADLAVVQAKQKQIEDAVTSGVVVLDTDQQKTAMSLGKQFEDESKTFKIQANAYNQILSSADGPSAAGDLSLIFGYMKMLDPNSVVRETEFANAENAAGVPEIIRAKYNKVLSGERLSDVTRNDFVDRASKIYNSALSQQIDLEDTYRSQGTKVYGLPQSAVDLLVRDIRAQGSVSDTAFAFTLNNLSNNQIIELQQSGLLSTSKYTP